MERELEGKCALVTGAGRGIGSAVARTLAMRGARVLLADIDEDRARETARELCDAGCDALAAAVDVSDPESMRELVNTTVDSLGALHLAVNNAGISGPLLPTPEFSIEDWRKVIDTNLNSVFYGLKYQIPAIIASGGGAIVNMASMFSVVARADYPAYVAAKHGVLGLTRAAALDCAEKGVRINAVGPGVIETPLLTITASEEAKTWLRSLHPVNRFGLPEEVAELTAFLLSDRARFMTGGFHPIDGGCTAR